MKSSRFDPKKRSYPQHSSREFNHSPKKKSMPYKGVSRLSQPINSSTVKPQQSTSTILPSVVSKSVSSKRTSYKEKYLALLDEELSWDIKEEEDRRRFWSRDRLVREGIAIFDLTLTLTSKTSVAGEQVLKLSHGPNTKLDNHQLTIGDLVTLRGPRRFEVLDIVKGSRIFVDSVEASVCELDSFSIHLSCSTPPKNIQGCQHGWSLEKSINRIAYDRMRQAILTETSTQTNFPSTDLINARLSKFLPPQTGPNRELIKRIIIDGESDSAKLARTPSILDTLHRNRPFPSDFRNWKLNTSQRETILNCIGRTLSLIQGPPGTGKTHTLVHLIRLLVHIYKGTGITILACAFTNVATDNLLEGCLDAGINALRVGRPLKVRPELRQATLEAKIESHPKKAAMDKISELISNSSYDEIKSLRLQLNQLQREIVADIMGDAEVICSTCIFAGDPRLHGLYFPIVIIDECTQAIEPATLVPIAVGCAQQVILVGDHHQLPPTVKSDTAIKSQLNISLFSRLIMDAKIETSLLNVQYRMHPSISFFPSLHFYQGNIQDGITDADRPMIKGIEWPNSSHPISFDSFTTLEGESRPTKGDPHSWINIGEAYHVKNIVKSILDTKALTPKNIGIITPYAGQVNLICDFLKPVLEEYNSKNENTTKNIDEEDDEHNINTIGMFERREHGVGGISVSSVDGFQGREKELIIFSTVRSNQNKRLGFLTDWRRLNVAITRSRRGLIITGDESVLCHDPHWKAWIEWIKSIGALRAILPPEEVLPTLPIPIFIPQVSDEVNNVNDNGENDNQLHSGVEPASPIPYIINGQVQHNSILNYTRSNHNDDEETLEDNLNISSGPVEVIAESNQFINSVPSEEDVAESEESECSVGESIKMADQSEPEILDITEPTTLDSFSNTDIIDLT